MVAGQIDAGRNGRRHRRGGVGRQRGGPDRRWQGARAVGVVRDPAQEKDVTATGARAVVNADPAGLADAVKAATDGRGADLILDTVGGAMLEPCLNALATRGRLVEITATSQRRVEFDLLDFYRRELTLRGVNTLFLDSTAGRGRFGIADARL